jgi:ABC-type polysaccharide transport system, permease component
MGNVLLTTRQNIIRKDLYKTSEGFLKEFIKNKVLYLMALPAITFLIIFAYIPIYGIQIAFRDFNFADGVSHSPWMGFKNFEFFFKSNFFITTTFNTLRLNLMFIFGGIITQVFTAILLNEVIGKNIKKLYQTAMFFPYFISWIMVDAFIRGLLNDRFGVVNNIIRSLGSEGIAWYNEASYWPYILLFIYVWKSLGYGTIIYLAKITSINNELYEAANIDGANKLQEITCITLPMLRPTAILLLLIAIGGIFGGDFTMIYGLIGDNGMLLPTTEIISTYTYRAMRVNAQYGTAAAVGLFQSVMGFILVLFSNYLIKRYDRDLAIF